LKHILLKYATLFGNLSMLWHITIPQAYIEIKFNC